MAVETETRNWGTETPTRCKKALQQLRISTAHVPGTEGAREYRKIHDKLWKEVERQMIGTRPEILDDDGRDRRLQDPASSGELRAATEKAEAEDKEKLQKKAHEVAVEWNAAAQKAAKSGHTTAQVRTSGTIGDGPQMHKKVDNILSNWMMRNLPNRIEVEITKAGVRDY